MQVVVFLDETCLRFVGCARRPRLSFVLPVSVVSFPMHMSCHVSRTEHACSRAPKCLLRRIPSGLPFSHFLPQSSLKTTGLSAYMAKQQFICLATNVTFCSFMPSPDCNFVCGVGWLHPLLVVHHIHVNQGLISLMRLSEYTSNYVHHMVRIMMYTHARRAIDTFL